MDIPLSIFYSSLATVAVIIAVGWFAGHQKWIDEHTNKTIINLLLLIAMPAALFSAFPGEFRASELKSFLYGIGGGLLVFIAAVIISRLLFPKKRHKKKYFEYQFAYIFNNASFIGLPLISTLNGGQVPIAYAGFIIVFNLTLFSYGVMLFEQKFDWRHLARAFVNPNVIAIIIGTLFFILSWKLPTFAENSLQYIGSMMTPLALLCIGYMLSRTRLRDVLRQKILVLTSVAQLVLGPLATFVVLKLIGAPSDVVFILTLIQALPTATSLGLFAEQYTHGDKSDVSSASELVALSTVMSAVTLPIVMWLVLRLL
jgi:predicted permease